jgi:hypothetical protein
MNDDWMHTLSSLEDLINVLCKNTTNKIISKTEYDKFCKEFVFDKLKGKRFGESFCEKFNVDSFILSNLSDETAKHHIEKLGYIK